MCGITGIFYKNKSNALEIYESLLCLQHRGQDGAGLCCIDQNKQSIIKRKGLICNIFTHEELINLQGTMFLAHNRYKTNDFKDSSQPFSLKNDNFSMYLIHNGNIINHEYIKKILQRRFDISIDNCSDSLVLFNLIFYYLNSICNDPRNLNSKIINEMVNFLHVNIEGSFNIILIIKNYGMIVIKDKSGIRPLVYGKNKEGDILISSESCSFNNVINYSVINDVEPGETIIINNDNIESLRYDRIDFKPCLFEYIYFSRLDSMIHDVSIYKSRFYMGKLLAEKIKKDNLEIDFIIPTPETSRVYAYGMSEDLNIPIQECIIKNRYINRTFIMENKDQIKENVKRKFSVIKEIVKNKNVLLIDDSIVRGNTSKGIINLLKEANVNKVYFGSAAPKVLNSNNYGIHIEKKEELITFKCKTNEDICRHLQIDNIYFNDLEKIIKMINSINKNIINFETSIFQD